MSVRSQRPNLVIPVLFHGKSIAIVRSRPCLRLIHQLVNDMGSVLVTGCVKIPKLGNEILVKAPVVPAATDGQYHVQVVFVREINHLVDLGGIISTGLTAAGVFGIDMEGV